MNDVRKTITRKKNERMELQHHEDSKGRKRKVVGLHTNQPPQTQLAVEQKKKREKIRGEGLGLGQRKGRQPER